MKDAVAVSAKSSCIKVQKTDNSVSAEKLKWAKHVNSVTLTIVCGTIT